MKFTSRQRKSVRRLLEMVEPRQLLSAMFLNAVGTGTTLPQGMMIKGMAMESGRGLRVVYRVDETGAGWRAAGCV